MHEVPSTFQLSSALRCHEQKKTPVNIGQDRIFESLQVRGQTGNCPAQLSLLSPERAREFDSPWKNRGIINSTSEMSRTAQILRTDNSVRNRTQRGLDHTKHEATLINKVVGKMCPISPPTVWVLNQLFTRLRPHSRTDLSLRKSSAAAALSASHLLTRGQSF